MSLGVNCGFDRDPRKGRDDRDKRRRVNGKGDCLYKSGGVCRRAEIDSSNGNETSISHKVLQPGGVAGFPFD